jgi:murein DD-endopeptidase MepM/ murein hydrolase activator NlpD
VAEGSRSFRQGVAAANDGIGQLAALRAVARQLPLRRPLALAEITSGFGTRLDPFFSKPSYHAGVDFRSDAGSSVHATAAGQVVVAGNNGGYGIMVEIDHGSGLTTRYAHLSSISVKAGDRVAAGTVVGHVGTTGRSTGPHLHYEVRVEGEAIDPMRYIRAGRELRGLL